MSAWSSGCVTTPTFCVLVISNSPHLMTGSNVIQFNHRPLYMPRSVRYSTISPVTASSQNARAADTTT
jgi:hypothetical protein